jgi:restriction system protein
VIYEDQIRSDPNSVQAAYDRALQQHGIALREEQSVEEAKMRIKRSYWEGLTGYQFEEATAVVLKLHGFEVEVTPGSGDGGIDIEVARDGRMGVVQCKAHFVPVSPSVLRELYGVIHHCKADFGIAVSLNGFTMRGEEFAHGKPILLVDVDDLIAMQEGIDVVGKWLKHVFEA